MKLSNSYISKNKSLTRTQLQQAIDYIHAHLDQDLSLVQIAEVIKNHLHKLLLVGSVMYILN
jgi:YesN/AraC family two-component response regulator